MSTSKTGKYGTESTLAGGYNVGGMTPSEANQWHEYLTGSTEWKVYISASQYVDVLSVVLSGAPGRADELAAAIRQRDDAFDSLYSVGKAWWGTVLKRRGKAYPSPDVQTILSALIEALNQQADAGRC